MSEMNEVEEIIIPTNLNMFLNDVADSRFGYTLGEPWKYSDESLGVVVPILREDAPERRYTTIYEALKDLNIKDTGSIGQVELQNKSGIAIFVRAGTIFTGKTQNRAAHHSGVYKDEKDTIEVRCVHASYGINRGENMEFGDIAPPSVTIELMKGNQSDVWSSVRYFTGSSANYRRHGSPRSNSGIIGYSSKFSASRGLEHRKSHPIGASHLMSMNNVESTDFSSDDLLGHLNKIKNGQSALDDMMQKVPLFPHQVGAIIFNPVGVIAIEMFDHPKSWESIRREIIEKYGDKIKETQAEHLFELKPETIIPTFRKFIDSLNNFTEKTIQKDDFSETREVVGDSVIGEYTIVKGQPIHVLLLKEEKNNT